MVVDSRLCLVVDFYGRNATSIINYGRTNKRGKKKIGLLPECPRRSVFADCVFFVKWNVLELIELDNLDIKLFFIE